MRVAPAVARAVASLLVLASPTGAADQGRGLDPLPMSRGQILEAGAAGTGCSFLVSGGRAVVFAAADDRAVVRLAVGMVPLRPAPGASDLFPFTYDRWTGGGYMVTLRATGRAVRRGSESLLRPAGLRVSRGGRAIDRRGLLDCGS